MLLVTATDKRRQQESRVAMLLSLEKLTSVGRRLNWCGRQQHTSHYGENCVAAGSKGQSCLTLWVHINWGRTCCLSYKSMKYQLKMELQMDNR